MSAKGKLGIANLSIVIGVGAMAATHGFEIFEDKKVGLGDIPSFIALGNTVSEIQGVEFAQVLPEMKDLDQMEGQMLTKIAKQKFELPEGLENVEKVVESILDYSYKVALHLLATKALFNEGRALIGGNVAPVQGLDLLKADLDADTLAA